MIVLRIRHPVADFDRWKAAFDADPLDRRASGVRAYTVQRWASDPDMVEVELEFDAAAEAEAMLRRLRTLWAGGPAGVLATPETWLLESVERTELD